MSLISCIIIDDEELARTLLQTYVNKIKNLTFKLSFENPLEALDYLKKEPVDLIFLDIQMPELTGTEFAELVAKYKTKIIFTTAYSEYAIKGFELSALDYLVKPITFSRFLAAVEKYPKLQLVKKQQLVIKSGYNLHKVYFNDILYIESDSEYVNYHLNNGKKIMANQSLSKLIEVLPQEFMRVHRSYIVNTTKVSGLKARELEVEDAAIPVSDSYFDAVKTKLFN